MKMLRKRGRASVLKHDPHSRKKKGLSVCWSTDHSHTSWRGLQPQNEVKQESCNAQIEQLDKLKGHDGYVAIVPHQFIFHQGNHQTKHRQTKHDQICLLSFIVQFLQFLPVYHKTKWDSEIELRSRNPWPILVLAGKQNKPQTILVLNCRHI